MHYYQCDSHHIPEITFLLNFSYPIVFIEKKFLMIIGLIPFHAHNDRTRDYSSYPLIIYITIKFIYTYICFLFFLKYSVTFAPVTKKHTLMKFSNFVKLVVSPVSTAAMFRSEFH